MHIGFSPIQTETQNSNGINCMENQEFANRFKEMSTTGEHLIAKWTVLLNAATTKGTFLPVITHNIFEICSDMVLFITPALPHCRCLLRVFFKWSVCLLIVNQPIFKQPHFALSRGIFRTNGRGLKT